LEKNNRSDLGNILIVDVSEFEFFLNSLYKDTTLAFKILNAFIEANNKKKYNQGADLLSYIRELDIELKPIIDDYISI